MWLDYKVLIFARFTKVWIFNKSEDLGHRSTDTTIRAFFVSEREREKERERKRNESFEVLSVVFLVATVRWPYTAIGHFPRRGLVGSCLQSHQLSLIKITA